LCQYIRSINVAVKTVTRFIHFIIVPFFAATLARTTIFGALLLTNIASLALCHTMH